MATAKAVLEATIADKKAELAQLEANLAAAVATDESWLKKEWEEVTVFFSHLFTRHAQSVNEAISAPIAPVAIVAVETAPVADPGLAAVAVAATAEGDAATPALSQH